MNLVGHVAVAVRATPDATPAHLVGCMLPDLAAIGRVRLAAPTGALGDGVAFHHATDVAFHSSTWFNTHNQALRDELLEAGVDRGASRACAHAGLEMLLDGALVADLAVDDAVRGAFTELSPGTTTAATVRELAAPHERAVWAERLTRIATSLDPQSYASTAVVADRLHRMTRGRSRIELRAEHVPTVTHVLTAYRPIALADADDLVDQMVVAVRGDGVRGVRWPSGVGHGPQRRVFDRLEEIAPSAHRAHLEAEASDATTEAQHVHVERVARRTAARPRSPHQRVTSDHRPESIHERGSQRPLDRRQRHPSASVTQQAVHVDGWRNQGLAGARRQRGDSGAQVVLRSREADPVFEGVDRRRRCQLPAHEQEPRRAGTAHALQSRLFFRPTQQHDVDHRPIVARGRRDRCWGLGRLAAHHRSGR